MIRKSVMTDEFCSSCMKGSWSTQDKGTESKRGHCSKGERLCCRLLQIISRFKRAKGSSTVQSAVVAVEEKTIYPKIIQNWFVSLVVDAEKWAKVLHAKTEVESNTRTLSLYYYLYHLLFFVEYPRGVLQNNIICIIYTYYIFSILLQLYILQWFEWIPHYIPSSLIPSWSLLLRPGLIF